MKLDNDHIFKEVKKTEIHNCDECGKRHWIYWHVAIGPSGNERVPEMSLCAPCYFSEMRVMK